MKILLIPLAILAFVVFLIVLGAIGLAVAFAVLWVLNRAWRVLSWIARLGRPRRRSTSADA